MVNVASGAGYAPQQTLTAYCATKSAVIMLSQCLRADWGPRGVGVSVICPGAISTPIASNARMVGAVASKRAAAERLLRRGRSPDVVANAIAGAVERNRGLVPVGVESTLAFRPLRFACGSRPGRARPDRGSMTPSLTDKSLAHSSASVKAPAGPGS